MRMRPAYTLDYQSVNRRESNAIGKAKAPGHHSGACCTKPVKYGTVRQTNFMVTRFDADVNIYFMSGRAEGGRVELQWLMSHSLV